MYKHPLINRDKMTPKEAFDILIEGNQRFVNNLSASRDLLKIVNTTKNEQKPFAAILGCSDSRTASEIIFDQGLGDIFSVRLAGNVASRYAIASIEYSCIYLKTKLVVVLGHTKCGAVRAACDHFKEGYIGELISHIRPAVQVQESISGAKGSGDVTFVNQVSHNNIALQMNTILKESEILKKMLDEKQIGLVSGLYNVETGHVSFNMETVIF